jgi:hypothetical protein
MFQITRALVVLFFLASCGVTRDSGALGEVPEGGHGEVEAAVSDQHEIDGYVELARAAFAALQSGNIEDHGSFATIVVSGTGQIAWMGFGSKICRKNRNREIQRGLKEDARERAVERAERALLGIINGQKIETTSKLEEEFAKNIEQLVVVIDPEGNEATAPLADDRVKLGAQEVRRSGIGTVTVGQLPPGVNTRAYYTKDGNWAYAIAIYMPEATEAAKGIAASMAANSPLRKNLGKRYQVNADGSFKVGKDGRLIPASMGNGRVTRDSDL